MKAILIASESDERISTVAIPGLCTGVGRMNPIISARQMFYAFEEVVQKKRLDFKNFGEAQKHHWNLTPQGKIWTH